MAVATNMQAFYRVTALAASKKLHKIAIDAMNKASCKEYTAIPPIETEKNSSVKQTSNVNPFQTITIRKLRVQIKKSNHF